MASDKVGVLDTGTVYCQDAVELLKFLPASSVAAHIIDPPFFIGMGRDAGGQGGDPWSEISDIDKMVEWSMPLASEMFRTLRPGGASVVMGGSQSLSAWEIAAERVGLVWMAELTILWNTGKPRARNFGSLQTTVRWHAKPGARHTWNSSRRAIYSNILVATKIPFKRRSHAAQKPVEVMNFFVSLLTNEGDLVVDPFCGSGSTLVSAAMCGRRWIGGDMDPEHAQAAQARARNYVFEEHDLGELYLWVNGTLYPVAEEAEEVPDTVEDMD